MNGKNAAYETGQETLPFYNPEYQSWDTNPSARPYESLPAPCVTGITKSERQESNLHSLVPKTSA